MAMKRMDPIAAPVSRRLAQAITRGIDDTTAAAAISAKQNHPGWNNRTGTAEGSIRMEPSRQTGPHSFQGRFGSFDVGYFIWLEIGANGHPGDFTLRRAADAEFPTLGRRIGAHL